METSPARTGLNKNLLLLHFTVVIWGFTGTLGKLITLTAVDLVWYRVLIAALSLFIYFKFSRTPLRVSRAHLIQFVLNGALVGAHWILFFASIKLSTVAVTLVCLSSITLFTAIFEPLINKKPVSRLEVLAGFFIIMGIVMIFKFETQYTKGIIAGLCSAIAGSLFAIINSRLVRHHQAPVIAFYELSGAWVWITIFVLTTGGFAHFPVPGIADAGYLLLLGTVCTSIAYVAGVHVMRELSAFRVALITNLEPVYGILIAFVFFGDLNKMTPGFWAGAGVILSTILLYPLVQKRLKRE